MGLRVYGLSLGGLLLSAALASPAAAQDYSFDLPADPSSPSGRATTAAGRIVSVGGTYSASSGRLTLRVDTLSRLPGAGEPPSAVLAYVAPGGGGCRRDLTNVAAFLVDARDAAAPVVTAYSAAGGDGRGSVYPAAFGLSWRDGTRIGSTFLGDTRFAATVSEERGARRKVFSLEADTTTLAASGYLAGFDASAAFGVLALGGLNRTNVSYRDGYVTALRPGCSGFVSRCDGPAVQPATPTPVPSATSVPTAVPTAVPTTVPTVAPTVAPTATPAEPPTPAAPVSSPPPEIVPQGTPVPPSCTRRDFTDVIFALDGATAAQYAVVRNAAARLGRTSPDRRTRAFVASVTAEAERIHMKGWADAWSLPQVISSCPLAPNCTVTDLAPRVRDYLDGARSLERLVRSVVGRSRRMRSGGFDQRSEKNLLRKSRRYYQEAVTLSKKVPPTSTECGG